MTQKSSFTKRELEIIALLIQGKSNKQIGLKLSISLRTVEYHITNILAKLNVSSRTEAVIKLSESHLRFPAGETEDILRKPTVDVIRKSSDNNVNSNLNANRRIPMKKSLIIFSAIVLIAMTYIAVTLTNKGSVFIPANTPFHAAENRAGDITPLFSSTVQTIPTISPVPTSTLISHNVSSPTAITIPELVITPTTTWVPTVISPIFPDQNIYLPPLPLQFGAWPATAGCPNQEGLDDYAGLLPEVVTDVLQHMAIGTHEAEMQWTDPAYWPVLINPFKDQTITQEWIYKIAPVSKSTYAQLITAQCGEETMKLSWWAQVCPGPCQISGASQSIMVNIFLIARMQWLIWAIQ